VATTIDGSASVTINSGAVLGITSGTAVASTSGTSIDFTGLPSWIKRITVMFSGVSLSGTAGLLVQIGAGSVTTSGYVSSSAYCGTATVGFTSTAGFLITSGGSSADLFRGIVTIATLGSNVWVSQGNLSRGDTYVWVNAGSLALSGTLDRIRITTTNGTDAFDAGTINIMYEG